MFDTAVAAHTTVEIAGATTQGELTVATPDVKTQLTAIAQTIKVEMKRTVESVIKIGTLLLQAKELTADPKCGYEGRTPDHRFSAWLKAEEFSAFNERLRANFINVARVYGDRDPSELDGIGLSILYELAAPSTPADTRAQIEVSIQSGEQPTVKDVKAAIRDARADAPAAPAPAAPAPTVRDTTQADEDDTLPWEDDPSTPPTPTPTTSSVEDNEEGKTTVGIFDRKPTEEEDLRL